MNIIITMAGLYKRFRVFGNRVPKYLLAIDTRTILWFVLKNLIISSQNYKIYLVANEKDIEFNPIILAIMRDLSIKSENLLFIKETKSQLETANFLIKKYIANKIDSNEKIVFHNCDTVILDRRKLFKKITTLKFDESLVDTFQASSRNYSYILKEKNKKNIVNRIADKILLSDMACSGLYSFGSAKFFIENSDKILLENNNANFTNLYQNLLSKGNNVYFMNEEDESKTIVLGTPDDYLANLHKFSGKNV